MASGEWRWVNDRGCVIERDSAGPAQLTTGVLTDISLRHAQLDHLATEHQRLRHLIDSLPDIVWLKDANGVFRSANRGFQAMVGAREEDIIGQRDEAFVSPEQAAVFRANDQATLAGGTAHTNEEWVTFKDGSRHLLETIKNPTYDSAGQLLGILGIARDITATREIAERFKRGLPRQPGRHFHQPDRQWRVH